MPRTSSGRITVAAGVIVLAAASFAACQGAGAPAEDMAAADTVTASWEEAFNSGDPAALAALYADDATSTFPGGALVSGRDDIEAYWRNDIGAGDARTTMTASSSVAQQDLLHVAGSYEVASTEGITLAKGRYAQLWSRADGQWKVRDEMWRIDPSTQRDPTVAEKLESLWTTAYNAGDSPALAALYDDDAILSTRPTGSIVGKDEIEAFWKDDFGGGTPATTLELTDAYLSGDLAHLEGEYEVTDNGEITRGHYVQLWMLEGNNYRIHREMWWK